MILVQPFIEPWDLADDEEATRSFKTAKDDEETREDSQGS